ncbi:MAG: hypothetical protein KKB51_21500 [Candidatus Riflebacteria bacterium]|nr:hypothetical protein [Candidatus Riflebacteria bacterium]
MPIGFNRRGLLPAKTALFRVDASPGMGMGHFMRCRTLAMELIRRNWVVFFIGSGLPRELLNIKSDRVNGAINLIEFGPHQTSSADVGELFALIANQFRLDVDCLIIDTYFYAREDFVLLQRFYERRSVLVIDDLANRDTPAQVVLNPNPLFSSEPYKRQKIPNILCGEKYTLIRPEIVALRDRPYNSDGIIMVTMGGGDVVKPLMRVLEAIPDNIENRICVSVSANCPRDEIDDWINRDSCRRFLNIDSEKFPKLLASSAFAITGGGTTLWEVYCLGIPSLCMVWVDNQKQTSVVIKEQATSFLIDLAEQINQGLKSDFVESEIRSFKNGFTPAIEARRRQQESFSVSELIRRDKTSLLIDKENVTDAELIGRILQEFRNEPEPWHEMMMKQRALIDGAGASRCADVLDNLTWQDVELLESDWRKSFENWSL